MGKSLIRLLSNTKPFNRVEVDILKFIYKVLNGKVPQTGIQSLIRSNIKGTYSLNGAELMYFYALYKMNYLESGDFSSIKNVEIPKMYDYNVNFLQDVSSWRSIDHNVIAADDYPHFLENLRRHRYARFTIESDKSMAAECAYLGVVPMLDEGVSLIDLDRLSASSWSEQCAEVINYYNTQLTIDTMRRKLLNHIFS